MTWQTVVFLGLTLVLAGGFVWYERSRPTARLIALVASLAALAVAGRLALAPVPNVVATTDIVLITGFALGAAPGFAVGALAAPISNIWLGQGPWTAWQMAGWGMIGLAGALLAVVSRRRVSRIGLAVACAAAGFLYGALLDFSTMVTYGGEQSLDRYLELSARGLPFNFAHAAGNFAIALAVGPALVRMISRFRTRLEFSWLAAEAVSLLVDRRDRRGNGWTRAVRGRRGARRSGHLASQRPGHRRRLRGLPRSALQPGHDRLGNARPRGGGDKPPRPAFRGRDPALLPALRGRPVALGGRSRAHDPGAERCGNRSAQLRR